MSYVSNYTFQNLSRMGNDLCYSQQRDIENSAYSNYMLKSYFANDCRMMRPIDLATSQPGIVLSGSHQTGIGGCNIDDNSRIFIGSIQSHPKCRISLFERPFATVPYLGRWAVNPIMESNIQQGEQTINKKSVNALGQTTVQSYYPPILAAGSQQRMMEFNDAIGTVPRAGLNSKDQYRDLAQTQKRF